MILAHDYLRVLPSCLEGTAALATALDRVDEAASLFGAAEALRVRFGRAVAPLDRERYHQSVARVRSRLTEPACSTAWQEGRGLSVDRAIAAAEAVLAAERPPDTAGALTAIEVAGLTDREADVLRLLVVGKSNPEIADELFIGRGTVRTHVSNILAKLDAKTRTEAADLARQRGIVRSD